MKLLVLLLVGSQALASGSTLKLNTDDVFKANAPRNFFPNPSCLKNVNGMTATTAALTRGTTNKIDGVASCHIGAATSGYVESTAYMESDSSTGGNCKLSGMYYGDASLYTAYLYDGTNVIGSVALTNSPSAWQSFEITSGCVPVTGFKLRLTQTGAAPAIDFGNIQFGKNTNVGTVAQAQFVGAAYFATTGSCAWARTNAALGAFTTAAACPGPTIENAELGSWQTTDADLPRVTINGLPAGIYEVDVSAHAVANDSTGGTMELAVSDGTDIRGSATKYGSDAGNEQGFMTVKAWFRYESSGNRAFELYGAKSAGELGISNGSSDRKTRFVIKKYPLSSQIAVTPDTSSVYYQGYHGSTCAWSVAGSDATIVDFGADATCSLTQEQRSNITVASATNGGNALPGLDVTANKQGKHNVCATLSYSLSTAAGISWYMSDGTTDFQGIDTGGNDAANSSTRICAIMDLGPTLKTVKLRTALVSGKTVYLGPSHSVSNGISWQITPVDQSLPMPVIVNSISTPYNGQAKHTAAQIGGTAYNNVCSASNCAVFNSLGTWINSITINGTGNYTLNFVTGTFPSVAICLTVMGSSTLFGNGSCSMYAQTNTSVSITCGNLNTVSNSFFSVMCDGY